LCWALSISRGGSCPRTAPSEPPHRAQSARQGTPGVLGEKRLSRLTPPRPAGRGPQRGTRVGVPRRPVRGHPREANVIRSDVHARRAGLDRRSADLQVRPVEYRSMNKVLANADEAVAPIPDGASILMGGF